MLHDHIIPKPAGISAYASHQLLEHLTNGQRPQFTDLGDHLIVRGDETLTDAGKSLPEVRAGDVLGFELVASCGTKCKGRHRYFPRHDWRSRKAWLERRAEEAGFEVRALSVISRSEGIERKGKTISIDRTQFTGILKVIDTEAFRTTLAQGVPGPARAFGRGMIRI